MKKRMFWAWMAAIALLGLVAWLPISSARSAAGKEVSRPRASKAILRSSPLITTTVQLPLMLVDAYYCRETPTLVYPPDGSHLDTITPLFQWDSGHPMHAHMLSLEVALTPDFGVLNRAMRTSDVFEEGAFRFPRNLEPATTYYWRAQFVCENDLPGPFTPTWSFTTGQVGVILPPPALLAPANGSVTESRTVTLSWEPLSGAEQYIVHYRESGHRGYIYAWTQNASLTRVLHANATYEWWVSAMNEYAIGEESETWQFTTPAD
ncbi:MAG: fibronectin type III domain-containing protein [Chloroflexi bacterium]|nr:fibronectin type III domain-containing protein [Chloroflexota bacterium]